MRSEDPAVDVRLVDHDPGQVRQHVAPLAMVREDADVQHVRVGQDQVAAPADRPPLLAGCVAVVDRVPQERGTQRRELARLVLGEGLGRVEVDRACTRVAREGVEHGQVERERLAAGRAGRDDHVVLVAGEPGIGLVGVELLDPRAGERLGESGVNVAGDRRRTRAARPKSRLRYHLLAATRIDEPLPGRCLSDHGHGLPI